VDDTFSRSCVATITRHGNAAVSVEGFAHVQLEENQGTTSFMSFVRSKVEWNWIHKVIASEEDVWSIARDLQSDYGMAVSDGSFKDKRGTASVVIEGKNSKQEFWQT
jgi:hypothetical protein